MSHGFTGTTRRVERDNAERDGGDEHHYKRSLPEVFSAVEGIGGLSVWGRKEPTLKGIRVEIPSPK